MPSARTAPYLREAAGLAEELNCPLVVLCSKHARPAEIIRYIEDHVIVADVLTVDVPGPELTPLPAFETGRLLRGTVVERTGYDTSFKRNLGLALAYLAGWSRVVFLDDDMSVPDPRDLRWAASLLDGYAGVGLTIGGYPDNSVVCHAHREAGGWQDSFVGGGALAVPTDRPGSFFPDVYNEDWFFLLGDNALQPVALVGEARQQPYDPFADPDRARREEFGDDLAEGVFSLLDRGGKLDDADLSYWRAFLAARGRLIDDILRRTTDVTGARLRSAMRESLLAARGRLNCISAELCVRYLDAWRADRNRWQDYLDGLDRPLDLGEALRQLRLGRRHIIRWNRTGPAPKEPRLRGARKQLDLAARRGVRSA